MTAFKSGMEISLPLKTKSRASGKSEKDVNLIQRVAKADRGWEKLVNEK